MHDEIFTSALHKQPSENANPIEKFLHSMYGAPSQDELAKRHKLKDDLEKLNNKNIVSLHDLNTFDIEIIPDEEIEQAKKQWRQVD